MNHAFPWSDCSNAIVKSDARGLDRSELDVFLFTAEKFDRDHAALAFRLGLNGLRVSEACATNIEDLGIERGHRTLRPAFILPPLDPGAPLRDPQIPPGPAAPRPTPINARRRENFDRHAAYV